jgi:hypothetical protein
VPDFLHHTYDEASTVVLSSSTPNIGSSWVRRPVSSGGTERDANVVGGAGVVNIVSGSAFYTNNAAPAGTDYFVESVWSASFASFYAAIFNYTSPGNFYQAVVDYYGNQIRFERLVAWSATTIGTPVSVSRGLHTSRVELTAEGANKRLKFFFDTVESINVLDTSALSGVGSVGLFMDGGDALSITAGDLGGAAGLARAPRRKFFLPILNH